MIRAPASVSGKQHRFRGVILALLACFSIYPVTAGAAMPAVGEKAPGWALRNVDGERVKFPRAAQDRPAVVLFWASWCPYCKALMPHVSKLKAEFANTGLEVFAINFAEYDSAASQPLPPHAASMPFMHFMKGDAVAGQYDIKMLPALFLIRDGRILYRLDYPPPDHPSQVVREKHEQARLLGSWWENRLRGVLQELVP